MATNTTTTFHWADYVVFGVCMAASAGFGIYTGLALRKKTARQILTGRQNVRYPAVAMSILASFLTSPFVLGAPSEIYYFGTTFCLIVIGFFMATPFVAHFFLVILHRLKLTISYQYFDERYGRKVRLAAGLVFTQQTLLFGGMMIYTPSLAFSQLTGLPLDGCIIGAGIICMVFTAVGGLKAVLWIDPVYMVVTISILCFLTVYGTVDAGGAAHVWEVASAGERIAIHKSKFDINPLVRHSFWTQTIGCCFMAMNTVIANQATAQKLLSLRTLRDAQKAMYMTAVLFFVAVGLMTFLGLVIYTYYEHCDPLLSGRVAARDQLLIIYMMDLIGHLHGLPGLFTAAIFTLSLSPVSAGLNAIAGLLILQVMPVFQKRTGHSMTRRQAKMAAKAMACIFGCITVGAAYLVGELGMTILQVVLSIYATCSGPIMGMIMLGMFFPFANSIGAICGLVSSLALTIVIMIGSTNPDLRPSILSISTANCSFPPEDITNGTTDSFLDSTAPPESVFEGRQILKLSYMYYSIFALVVCMTVGVTVSLITGCLCPSTRVRKVNPKTLVCRCGFCFRCTNKDAVYDVTKDVVSTDKPSGISTISNGEISVVVSNGLVRKLSVPDASLPEKTPIPYEYVIDDDKNKTNSVEGNNGDAQGWEVKQRQLAR